MAYTPITIVFRVSQDFLYLALPQSIQSLEIVRPAAGHQKIANYSHGLQLLVNSHVLNSFGIAGHPLLPATGYIAWIIVALGLPAWLIVFPAATDSSATKLLSTRIRASKIT
jgi:hypothetical protein